MRFSFIIFLVFLVKLGFSQTITLPHNDTTIVYDISIKTEGDSTKHKETAYFKTDTTKIAWIKYFVDTNIVGVYKEYFLNGNTHKTVHIGHLRNLFLGDSLVRIVKAAGYKVVNSYYINF